MSKFIDNIIESIASDPDSWTLEEEVSYKWVKCNSDHPDAEKRDCRYSISVGSRRKKRRNRAGGIWHQEVYWRWERRKYKYSFLLSHSSGETILTDHDARSYEGWTISKPSHVKVNWWNSRKLSKAVLKWREYKLFCALTEKKKNKNFLKNHMLN